MQKRLEEEQKSLRLAGGGGGRLAEKDKIGAGAPKTGRRVWKIGSTAQKRDRKPKIAGKGRRMGDVQKVPTLAGGARKW